MSPFACDIDSASCPLSFFIRRYLFAVIGLSLLSVATLCAAPLNPNNLLLAIQVGNNSAPPFTRVHSVLEYTPTGHLVQTIPFDGHEPIDFVGDIVVDSDGVIDAVDGLGGVINEAVYFPRYFPATETLVRRPLEDIGPNAPDNMTAYQPFVFSSQGAVF